MIVGVPKETHEGETRIALTPVMAGQLQNKGFEVLIEKDAGTAAGFPDHEFSEKGATLVDSRADIFSKAEIILQVRAPGANTSNGAADIELLKEGQSVIGFCDPLTEHDATKAIAAKKARLFSMEMMPRITRAQSMDALSSMATVAGYKAVLLAASELPRMFPMMMTAAGTIKPAKVFVIGAGVMGLQAIAMARRLGAVVEGYDVRPVVKEQVESLGAKFVELNLETEDMQDKGGYAKAQGEEFYNKQRQLMAEAIAGTDVLITTAAIPGRASPLLVTEDGVKGMPFGSVVIDMAAERGGNVAPSKPGETVMFHGVKVLGPINLPATVPYHASQMYSKNIITFLTHLVKDGKLEPDLEDEITVGTLITNEGEVVHDRIRDLMGLPKKEAAPVEVNADDKAEEQSEEKA